MAPTHTKPFAITLEVEVLDRMSEPVREGRAPSVSEIVRVALERFDFANVVVLKPNQVRISVRLPVAIRRALRTVSRRQHVSVGHLVRAAVEQYLPQLEEQAAGQLEIPIAAGTPSAAAPPARASRSPRPARSRRRRRAKARAAPRRGRRGMTKKRKG